MPKMLHLIFWAEYILNVAIVVSTRYIKCWLNVILQYCCLCLFYFRVYGHAPSGSSQLWIYLFRYILATATYNTTKMSIFQVCLITGFQLPILITCRFTGHGSVIIFGNIHWYNGLYQYFYIFIYSQSCT